MKRQFNENQSLAVAWINGPCLVLAGPGSGKTFVLVNRILNLIRNGVDPESILIITFTRAAANEMKERFKKLLFEEKVSCKSLPTFGTFHSVFYEILKEDFGYTNDSLISDLEEKRAIFELIERRKDLNVTADTISNILTDIKAYRLSLEREESFKPRYVSERLFNELYKGYTEKLFNLKKLDFFDMIGKCFELLSMHKEVLKRYQERYKYILIDEFQDINKSQYDIVKLLCKNKNLFVVGDDDQSIYRFRGSQPRVMRDFLSDYKGAKIIKLNENYRCAKVIVKFSKLVIDHNVERFNKDLVAKRDDIGKLEIKAFIDSVGENEYIIEKIREYYRRGIKYSDMAVLYRTNLLSSAISQSLNKNNIPYILKGEENTLYDNFAVKDIISYLKVAIGLTDSEDFLRIANKPLRYISRDSIGYNDANIDSVIKYYSGKDFMYKSLSKFKYDLHNIKKLITPLAIRYIRSKVGYDEYLKEYVKKKGLDIDEIIDILDTFEEDSIGHNDIKEFLDFINKDSTKNDKKIDEDAISLMTFHLSKGLEFKVVFIIDANDLLIPHKKSIKENDIETERRLFYVGMTRAKDFLHIFFTSRRFGKNFKASRFILEAIGGKDGKEV